MNRSDAQISRESHSAAPVYPSPRVREDNYQRLVLLLLAQGRTKEASDLMERHEARREWETQQEAMCRGIS